MEKLHHFELSSNNVASLYFSIFIQDTPSGVPELVIPDGGKIDLPHLKKHIPKYNLSEDALTWWNTFIESCLNCQREGNSWLYNDLLQYKQSETSVIVQQRVPENILKLRSAETKSIPEVRSM